MSRFLFSLIGPMLRGVYMHYMNTILWFSNFINGIEDQYPSLRLARWVLVYNFTSRALVRLKSFFFFFHLRVGCLYRCVFGNHTGGKPCLFFLEVGVACKFQKCRQCLYFVMSKTSSYHNYRYTSRLWYGIGYMLLLLEYLSYLNKQYHKTKFVFVFVFLETSVVIIDLQI